MTTQQQALLASINDTLTQAFDSEQATRSSYEATLAVKDQRIAELEAQVANPPPCGDLTSLQAQVDALQANLQNVTANRDELQANLTQVNQDLVAMTGERNSLRALVNTFRTAFGLDPLP